VTLARVRPVRRAISSGWNEVGGRSYAVNERTLTVTNNHLSHLLEAGHNPPIGCRSFRVHGLRDRLNAPLISETLDLLEVRVLLVEPG
jgi:hypothetical protein